MQISWWRTFLTAATLLFLKTGPLAAAGVVTLAAGESGARLAFAADNAGWHWTGLSAPGGPENGWSLDDLELIVTTETGDLPLGAAWSLFEHTDSQAVFEQTTPDGQLQFRREFSFGPATNTVRMTVRVRSLTGPHTIVRADLLSLRVAGESFQETGRAPASFPAFGRGLFAGIEHVSGACRATGDTVLLSQEPGLRIDDNWRSIASVVVGWPLPGTVEFAPGATRMRQAFLHYLDAVRIKPARIELHTNTWWTLPVPYSESDVLADIKALRQGFYNRTGMFFDSYALDLGWSDPHTVWRVDSRRFPNDLRVVNQQLHALGCRLGLWTSPGSAYPAGLDNKWLENAGYDMTPFGDPGDQIDHVACLALGGNYQQAYKQSLVDYAQRYGLGHAKLDFLYRSCDVAAHGHATGAGGCHAIDAGLADVLDSLREVNPAMALEPLVCGYPPSPWWTAHTPFVLGPHGDDVPAGRVPCPEWMESLITARDTAYRAHQEEWLMPTQALETFDIVVQSPGEYENMAVMAVGRGRWFLSTYLRPDLMKPADWDFLAALVRWERANQEYLGNAWLIGGRPENREAYGYYFHHPGRDIYCARNPWIEERTIEIPVAAAETRELRLIYPRRATLARIAPGAATWTVSVAPYETVLLESVPVGEATASLATWPSPRARLTANSLRSLSDSPSVAAGGRVRYAWDGQLKVPAIKDAQLCLLVEGGPSADTATCTVTVDGQAVTVAKSGSEGQFSAAAEPSPEHWSWFLVSLAASGTVQIHVELNLPSSGGTLSGFVRGTTAAINEPASPDGPVFPVFHATRRGWSQTLLPPTRFGFATSL